MYGATIGKLSIFGIDASTNQACAVAQPYKKLLNNEFLYYFLLSEKRGLIEAGKGGAQPNISQGILKEWPILLPPLLGCVLNYFKR
jgi:type I restriction enzyme, S subunit